MATSEFPQAVAIAVAPNGGRLTKADHPGIPLSAAELARTAAECLESGASMIHVHVRNSDGGHVLDADAYKAVTATIRSEVGDRIFIQVTSEALGIYSPAQQRAVVRASQPEGVSLALRELVPDISEEGAFADFLSWMRGEHILPQIILYAPDEAARLAEMKRRGLIPWDDLPVLYVLGRYTVGQTSTPSDLLPFLAPQAPQFAHWSVCAFGRHEAACVTASALLGGHIRVGFENNRFLPDGATAQKNADLVSAAASAIAACGLSPATADSWREMAVGLR